MDLAADENIPIRLLNAQTAAIKLAAERDKAALELSPLKARQIELEQRKAMLESVPDDITRNLWCADYTDDLSGSVGTAEIPGEGQEDVIILPHVQLNSAYNAERDGLLSFRAGMTGPQAYYNAAILPGWQKWMPTYRVGTVASVNYAADTCTVTLDDAKSSADDLHVNQAGTLTDIPIVYMTCNADAFEDGDRVLVQFQGQQWSGARVVGFESEPKPCLDWPIIYVPFQSITGEWSYGSSVPAEMLSRWEYASGIDFGYTVRQEHVFPNTQRSTALRLAYEEMVQVPPFPSLSTTAVNVDLWSGTDRVNTAQVSRTNTVTPERFSVSVRAEDYLRIWKLTHPITTVTLDSATCLREPGLSGCPDERTITVVWGSTQYDERAGAPVPPGWSGVSAGMISYNTVKPEYIIDFDDPADIKTWAAANGAPAEIDVSQGAIDTVYEMTTAVFIKTTDPAVLGRWFLRYDRKPPE